eukprot:SAG31_NODE_25260_length_464_cov_65.684932_1_plen_68_part_10
METGGDGTSNYHSCQIEVYYARLLLTDFVTYPSRNTGPQWHSLFNTFKRPWKARDPSFTLSLAQGPSR